MQTGKGREKKRLLFTIGGAGPGQLYGSSTAATSSTYPVCSPEGRPWLRVQWLGYTYEDIFRLYTPATTPFPIFARPALG